ncbi:MAG: PQQ-binding-like beta-propeller repeat protein, partial [Gammaproteobacteria bacterium]
MAAVVIFSLGVAACGGGGSGSTSGPHMSLSPAKISVSAKTTDPAPTAKVRITVTNPPKGGVYVGYQTTGAPGIEAINLAPVSKNVADLDIQFNSPANLGAGVYDGTLTVAACLDNQCNKQIAKSPQTVSIHYTITEVPPSLTSLSPNSSAPGSGAFTLTVNGAGFVSGSTVDWNGSARTTNYVSSSKLTAKILAADVEGPGTSTVTVVNPEPGGDTSNPLTFAVQYGKPSIGKMFPNATVEGGPAFTLTIVGDGFGSASKVKWNGDSRTTHFVSATELTAQISPSDISSTGAATVTVLNPAPGGSSGPATFTIKPVTSDAVAFQINAGHSGVMNFDSVNFPAQSTWTANVGGKPSYALIADGKVFVTVEVNGTAQLLALDQKTGAVVWGPIVLSDAANAAYDAGSVFVVSSPFGEPALMQAYNADTGSLEWSTRLSGQYGFSSGPTALNGFVYTGGAGSGGTLYALDETDGKIAWTQPVANGDDSTPAVTTDGIYVTYPCQTYDFRPGTGELVWHDAAGCDGGGGATPVVANGTLYAPNGFGDYNGVVFNAETGKLLGSYTADNPPAVGKTDGYFLQNGNLYDINLSN